MQWRSLLFMHWRVPVEVLRPLIPSSLEIDTFDGTAWIGLVPFTMRDVLPEFVPRVTGADGFPVVSDLPGVSALHECNVRTYVRPRIASNASRAAAGSLRDSGRTVSESSLPGAVAGVWFFSLDAASRLAVWGARKFFHLPYFYAKMHMDRRGSGGGTVVRYAVDRVDAPQARMRCSWRVGERLPLSQPGDLEYFLTERYALYTTDASGALRRCRIWHERWPLRFAELLSLEDELVRAAGIDMAGRAPESVLHGAEALDVHAWPLERV